MRQRLRPGLRFFSLLERDGRWSRTPGPCAVARASSTKRCWCCSWRRMRPACATSSSGRRIAAAAFSGSSSRALEHGPLAGIRDLWSCVEAGNRASMSAHRARRLRGRRRSLHRRAVRPPDVAPALAARGAGMPRLRRIAALVVAGRPGARLPPLAARLGGPDAALPPDRPLPRARHQLAAGGAREPGQRRAPAADAAGRCPCRLPSDEGPWHLRHKADAGRRAGARRAHQRLRRRARQLGNRRRRVRRPRPLLQAQLPPWSACRPDDYPKLRPLGLVNDVRLDGFDLWEARRILAAEDPAGAIERAMLTAFPAAFGRRRSRTSVRDRTCR